VEEIQHIADKYNLKVIYDAAHAFGEKYKEKGIGNYGDASVFSFHATKVFNTIEGGAVSFSDKELYEKLYNLKNFGIRGEETVVEIGANAKMNEFAAIMGLCNLRHIDDVIQERRLRAEKYGENLKDIRGIRVLEQNIEVEQNYGYFPIIVGEDYHVSRDVLYELLRKNNYFARKYFFPLTSDQACFKNKYVNSKLTVARELSKKVLVLPMYETLDFENQKEILDIICKN
jgi:dTDP-4-amino-4,6-dideoxygalactose transaminase